MSHKVTVSTDPWILSVSSISSVFLTHGCCISGRSLSAVFVSWQVKWSRENYHHSLSSPYSLRLASGDASGKIIVWDVVSGTAHCEIQEHSKPIQGIDRIMIIILVIIRSVGMIGFTC